MVSEGELLWEPSPERMSRSVLSRYLQWLRETHGRDFESYDALYRWSVADVAAFWASIWDFFGVRSSAPYTQVSTGTSMPGVRWFPGALLNYAEHALAARDGLRSDSDVAVVFGREDGQFRELSYGELRRQVAAARAGLRRMGVARGDRVAALLPNAPEALVAMLATASLGAIWSSCSPDFGARSVADRFAQIGPTVLLAVDGYRYAGKPFDITDTVTGLRAALPTLRHTVLVPYLDTSARLPGTTSWSELVADPGELVFEQVPFDHPLWILYSSGTTGLPKAIVHGHGGMTVEHLKALALHKDVHPDDRLFWFTTTGWMMWNLLVSGLLLGATIVLYDGSPTQPDLSALWVFAERSGITLFGTSAPFLHTCSKEGLRPRDNFTLRIHTLGSTGAPLSPEGFEWAAHAVGDDVLVASVSGGTDVCSGFVGSCPVLPVYAGEIQCRMLGAAVEAFDATGRSVVDEVGELVITQPMPSMPVAFWNDPNGDSYRSSYFSTYPGVWRHGDWIRITPRGTCIISGRSDSTLNRGGVRMGTSEFYRVVEERADVADSLVVDTGESLWLFVVPASESGVDESDLRRAIRSALSPRHVPDRIVEVAAVPRTLNGKKCEVPVKKILSGVAPETAVSADALANPHALDDYVRLAATTPE